MRSIKISTDYIKLDQLLKFAGLCENGAMAKQLIVNEKIKVNDEICTQRGKKIYPGTIVFMEDYGDIFVENER